MAGLSAGDTLPFCSGMSHDQSFYSFEEQAGRPIVLILAGMASPAQLEPLTKAFLDRRAAFAAKGVDLRILVQIGAPDWILAGPPEGLGLVHCPDRAIFDLAEAPAVLVTDRGQRLIARLDVSDPDACAEAALRAAPDHSQPDLAIPAPVLVRPHLFDPDLCRRLMERFEDGDHVDGTVASMDPSGALYNKLDAGKKKRRDLVLDISEPLQVEVAETLSARLVPFIAKAFHAEAAFIDRVVIARYDDTGGYFHRHRDNASPHLAYRQFALSVNLNTGDYEGGALCFPEFNDVAYSPPAGAGIVFSASLLHEASPVTKGSRYVLLTFLHSAAAEQRRVAGLRAA
jgi:predicted 2-oxoglutarate/Fe(II)-dependent dioxygenase YbiX